MSASSQHRYRFLQIILLLVWLGLAVSLYSNWHQIIRQIIEWQKVFHALLATHVNAIKQDPLNHGLALIALSFAYGVFHAIGPGHGKAVIITYLGSHQESLRRGAFLLVSPLTQKWKQHRQNKHHDHEHKNHSYEHNHSQHKDVHHHEHNCTR